MFNVLQVTLGILLVYLLCIQIYTSYAVSVSSLTHFIEMPEIWD